jgi:hypothetical protein
MCSILGCERIVPWTGPPPPTCGEVGCATASTYMFLHQGMRGLYRGLVPHMWRDGPGYGVYMVFYEGQLTYSKK